MSVMQNSSDISAIVTGAASFPPSYREMNNVMAIGSICLLLIKVSPTLCLEV